jgi:predicted MFS family arabinose efflux permease
VRSSIIGGQVAPAISGTDRYVKHNKGVRRTGYYIVLGMGAKFFVDTAGQIFDPFLRQISSGIGTTVQTLGLILAVRSLVGLSAPLWGALADRKGYRTILQVCLCIAGIGTFVSVLTGSPFLFALFIVIGGIGVAGFKPNLHAYLSGMIPYEKRGRGLGIVEYSYALAGVAGLPAIGFLIEAFNWKVPFYLLGGFLVLMAAVFFTLPRAREKIDLQEQKPAPAVGLTGFFRLGNNAVSAWVSVGVMGLVIFANVHLYIIYGVWLGGEYGLGPARLGTISFVFGIGDLVMSIFVSLYIDRLGKKRNVLFGTAGAAAGFLLLPFLNFGLIPAVAGLTFVRLCFQTIILGLFPLISEQVPNQRGKAISLGIAAGLLGSTFASITGPAAYLRFGVWGIGPVGFVVMIIVWLAAFFFVHDGNTPRGKAVTKK